MDDPEVDDPSVIAGRLAAAARKMISDAAQVATDAFDQINGDPPSRPPQDYTPGDAIKSMTRLTNIALTGGISLARVALQVQPDKGVLLVADNIASIVNRAITDTTQVAGDAAELVGKKKYGRDNWADSAIRLTSIAALRGAEIVETAVAGPGQYADPMQPVQLELSEADVDTTSGRHLTLLKLVRGGDDKDIKDLASIDPENCILKANKQHFTLVVNTVGLPSAIYVATVEFRRNKAPKDVQTRDFTFAL